MKIRDGTKTKCSVEIASPTKAKMQAFHRTNQKISLTLKLYRIIICMSKVSAISILVHQPLQLMYLPPEKEA